ncbi:MAG: NAD(P)H-hydrate dehydratase, partial [Bacteroidetes bacterium]|nr:NAD(P)H-hydrate dehydratase [Bacteroidota bacterium]
DLNKCSVDFQEQFSKVKNEKSIAIITLTSVDDFMNMPSNDVLIDAIFGTGLSRPLEGLYKQVVEAINQLEMMKVAIDVPSGMIADRFSAEGLTILQAYETLTFQVPKRAMLVPNTGKFAGTFTILDIGLSKEYIRSVSSSETYLEQQNIIIHQRKKYEHKGSHGHALLIAGGELKGGAAIMAAEACLRIGSGLLSVKIPAMFYSALLTRVPEAMLADEITSLEKYQAAAIGPGIDRAESNMDLLNELINSEKQLVIDADAIHMFAKQNENKKINLKGKVVFTPHIKEFDVLIGHTFQNAEDRLKAQLKFSADYNCYILLKGAHSTLSTPDGNLFFNSTGNPGMAKGGSGDVLTGMILGLLAQGYSVLDASLYGMYIHGLAGHIALKESHEMYMNPTDTIHCIGKALCQLVRA